MGRLAWAWDPAHRLRVGLLAAAFAAELASWGCMAYGIATLPPLLSKSGRALMWACGSAS
jgi:hypothetical protein